MLRCAYRNNDNPNNRNDNVGFRVVRGVAHVPLALSLAVGMCL